MGAGSDPSFPQCLIFKTGNKRSNQASYMKDFFFSRAATVQHQNWACFQCKWQRKKMVFGKQLIKWLVLLTYHVTQHSPGTSYIVLARKKIRPYGTEMVKKAEIFDCQCQMMICLSLNNSSCFRQISHAKDGFGERKQYTSESVKTTD